jgi:hypothetical protein
MSGGVKLPCKLPNYGVPHIRYLRVETLKTVEKVEYVCQLRFYYVVGVLSPNAQTGPIWGSDVTSKVFLRVVGRITWSSLRSAIFKTLIS